MIAEGALPCAASRIGASRLSWSRGSFHVTPMTHYCHTRLHEIQWVLRHQYYVAQGRAPQCDVAHVLLHWPGKVPLKTDFND